MPITIDVKNSQPAGTPSLKSQPEDEVRVARDMVAGASLARRVVPAIQNFRKYTSRRIPGSRCGDSRTNRDVKLVAGVIRTVRAHHCFFTRGASHWFKLANSDSSHGSDSSRLR